MARDKYPGPCYRCGKIVAKGEGHFERTKDGWRVQHVECCLKAKGLLTPHQIEKGQDENNCL